MAQGASLVASPSCEQVAERRKHYRQAGHWAVGHAKATCSFQSPPLLRLCQHSYLLTSNPASPVDTLTVKHHNKGSKGRREFVVLNVVSLSALHLHKWSMVRSFKT
eukprot:4713240-Amphidinium_carterae.1